MWTSLFHYLHIRLVYISNQIMYPKNYQGKLVKTEFKIFQKDVDLILEALRQPYS